MKILIEQKDLLNLLAKGQHIAEKRSSMAILVNVLLEAKTDGLHMFATDLKVSLTDRVSAQVAKEGSIAVNGKNFFEIVRELQDKPIAIERKENNWLEIKQGKYISKLVGASAEEYPSFPAHQNALFSPVSTQIIREMIDKTIFSVSMDETRYHLNGVYLEQKTENAYTMVATDGHRLSLINKNLAQKPLLKSGLGIIIPRKGLSEMRKMVETDDSVVEMAVEPNQIIIKKGSTHLMVALIEGKYPNYSQFIPAKLKQKAVINREAFLTSLKRVALLSNQKSKAVTLHFAPGRLELLTNNPELGDAREEIEVQYQGEELKVGFNAKYVQEILGSMNDESIDFEINDHLSPGLIRPHNNSEFLCIVMPMRI